MARNWNATQVEDFLAHLVCETTIGKRAENEEARTFEIKIGDLPLVSLERLIAYGAQRFVNDKLGGSDKDLKTKVEMAEAIIIDLYNGEVSKRREAVPADSMSAFRIQALREAIGKDVWKKVNAREDKVDVIKQLLTANAEKLEPRALELKAEADAAREKAKELGKGLDLGSLGL